LAVALFISVFLIAACGLIYELIAGTLSSYLLGDSVLQFSTVIGSYLFAMGVGSFLSRYLNRNLIQQFITLELMVAITGGFSSSLLFLAFGYTQSFRFVLYILVIGIGVLVGLEVPLLMRILKERFEFRDVVASVLTFDYLGALGASLLFPLWLLPRLGLVRAALAFGIINALVALWSTWLFRAQLANVRFVRAMSVAVVVVLATGILWSNRIASAADDELYADQVIFSRTTRYQRIVLTKWRDDLRLFLNAHLQFSSRDEYRYHEALVHPGLSVLSGARHVLVLGGGDGLALREVLKYPDVESITLVDLDREMTDLFTIHPVLSELNQRSFRNPRVHVVNADAFPWLATNSEMFDFAVVDFPDPTSYALGKLYTTAFYRVLEKHISRDGLFVVQSTSPLFARNSFWCIRQSIAQTGMHTWPYHLYVPSFGEWGFVLAGAGDYHAPLTLPKNLRFLTPELIPNLFVFPNDMQPVRAGINQLNDQILVRYYEQDWKAIER
jgi:spermidine synthase